MGFLLFTLIAVYLKQPRFGGMGVYKPFFNLKLERGVRMEVFIIILDGETTFKQ